MRTALMCAMLVFWSGTIFAQDPAAPPPSRNGASMQFTELPKSIDARKAKTGDRIEAKTTQDMLSNGKIVIPHDSKITGHITESQGRAKGQKGDSTSSLGIAFDTLTLKGGQEIPLHAEI